MKANALRLVLALLSVFGLLESAVGADSPRPPKTATTAKTKAPVRKTFFIIAPESFHGALTDYVEYKRKLRPTTLVSLEHVLSTTEGFDDPERLKRFLYVAWRRQHLGYVLLVGDVDVMPVRYMVLDRVTPAAFDYAFYPF